MISLVDVLASCPVSLNELGKKVKGKKVVLCCKIKKNKRVWSLRTIRWIDCIFIALFKHIFYRNIRLKHVVRCLKAERADSHAEADPRIEECVDRLRGCYEKKYKKKQFPIERSYPEVEVTVSGREETPPPV